MTLTTFQMWSMPTFGSASEAQSAGILFVRSNHSSAIPGHSTSPAIWRLRAHWENVRVRIDKNQAD
jgi:hypothetical protein